MKNKAIIKLLFSAILFIVGIVALLEAMTSEGLHCVVGWFIALIYAIEIFLRNFIKYFHKKEQ